MHADHWLKKAGALLGHALVGWAVCGAIIFIGRSVTTMQTTLIIHAIAVPIVFGLLSLSYFRFFNYTTPLPTAAIFFAVPFLLDLCVIAPFAEKSFAMFTSAQSVLGTWIPLGLIFLSTYWVGRHMTQPKPVPVA
jgi:hypothetical protein